MPANQPCDACGAHSKVAIALKSGGMLTLCAHHERVNRDAVDHYIDEVFWDAPPAAEA